jgi:hypothetical protein
MHFFNVNSQRVHEGFSSSHYLNSVSLVTLSAIGAEGGLLTLTLRRLHAKQPNRDFRCGRLVRNMVESLLWSSALDMVIV